MISRFGDEALRFDVPDGADRARLLAALRACEGVGDVVLAEAEGLVVLDADAGDAARAFEDAARAVEQLLVAAPRGAPSGRRHEVRVRYDGADLEALGLAADEIILRHTAAETHVVAMGFLPGFAYLRGVDPALAVPRRASPRPRVPARSVAVAAGYTGIYPSASPGGWHLLGTACGFRPFGPDGAALAVGDRVRFAATTERDAPAPPAPAPRLPARGLDVVRALGPALLVDGGRRGHMHEGVPRGGALSPAALARANAALGNPAGACAVEVHGALTLAAMGGPAWVADDDGGAVRLREGEARTFAAGAGARARYVALPGGLDAPVILGGRGALLTAGIGRLLARGDRIAPPSPERLGVASPGGRGAASDPDAAILVIGGAPSLFGRTFVVSPTSDRTGTRLAPVDEQAAAAEGASLAAPEGGREASASRPSAPMITGAIEQTPAGLVVLGPDHPTTGGYPVVGVVARAAQGLLFARPLGARVTFRHK